MYFVRRIGCFCRKGKKLKEMKSIVQKYLLNVILIVILLLLSIEDIKYKSIRLWELIVCICISVVYSCFSNLYGLKYIIISIAFFGVLLWVNMAAKYFGAADIFVIFMLNCVKGAFFSFVVFGMSITLAAVVNIFLCIRRKVQLKSTIPFIPYISICAVGVMICG